MRLPLAILITSAVITYIDAAIFSPVHPVENAAHELEEGSTIFKDTIEKVKNVVEKVDETIKKTERRIQQFTQNIGTIETISNKHTGEVFQKFEQVKKDMRAARRKLWHLADKTKLACTDLEIYIEGWDQAVDNEEQKLYLQEQIDIMEGLMKESLQLLTEAEKRYKTVIFNVDGVNTWLLHYHIALEKMLDKNSAEHQKWTSKLKGGAYGTPLAVTAGKIFADIFNSLGTSSTNFSPQVAHNANPPARSSSDSLLPTHQAAQPHQNEETDQEMKRPHQNEETDPEMNRPLQRTRPHEKTNQQMKRPHRPAVQAVEEKIARLEGKLRGFDALGNSIKEDFGNVKVQTSELITVLGEKLKIMAAWKNNAQQLDGRLNTLPLDKFERLHLYRNNFQTALAALRKSAEEYLDLPVEFFGNKQS